ncbi:hypothetical protein B0H11DRAFT_2112690, partial [Mycena galericulata]
SKNHPFSFSLPYHHHSHNFLYKMAFMSLVMAAGPSASTLRDLSDYCASSDSPNSSFSHSGSGYSFISATRQASHPMSVAQLPDVLLRSDRFQTTSIQDKIRKALKIPTKSNSEQRAVSFASTAGIYDGLPPSPRSSLFSLSDSDRSDSDSIEIITKAAPAPMGLGLLIPSPQTNELRLLSPLELRRASPIREVKILRSLARTSAPAMVRAQPLPAPRAPSSSSPASAPPRVSRPSHVQETTATRRAARYRNAGLGHGLPSHMRPVRASSNSNSNIRFTSIASSVRAVSHILSGAYPNALLNAMPTLARCPRSGMGQLEGGGVSTSGRGDSIVGRAWKAMSRLVRRDGKARLGFHFENPEEERRERVQKRVHVALSVSVCSRVL